MCILFLNNHIYLVVDIDIENTLHIILFDKDSEEKMSSIRQSHFSLDIFCHINNHILKNICWIFIFLLLISSGCIIDSEIKRDELNIWARNPDISRETKAVRIVEIIENTEEDPHYRATAAKLAGELKIEEAIDPMFRILGDNVTEPEKSEFLRLETVSALGNFGRIEIYRRMMLLLYTLTSWETSTNVRRFFIHSFDAVKNFIEGTPISRKQALAVELLIEMLKTANTKKEDRSIIHMINNRLKNISGHPELTFRNIQEWNEIKIKMLKEVRND